MKRITILLIVCCSWMIIAASTCFAQMYTVTNLGGLEGIYGQAYPRAGINISGEVAGYSDISVEPYRWHAFRTAPNSPINPATDDLGTLGGDYSYAGNINALGQVVGFASTSNNAQTHAFRTAPNGPINPTTDDLGTLDGTWSRAFGINDIGQVVGESSSPNGNSHAFRTTPNSPINPATDDLGTLGGGYSTAWRVNGLGQVVGSASISGDAAIHAFRTASNRPINATTDDLGTLGGSRSDAYDINVFGQVVGSASISGDAAIHAFRTAPNSPINPATDDLGTLGSGFSEALDIDDYGQVVGWPAFLYSNGVMHNLNDLIPAGSGWDISFATGINNAGQIAGQGRLNNNGESSALLLTPIYKALVQQPINGDGSSVFSAKRGTVPVKFRLTEYDHSTCTLTPATIAITKAGGGTLASVDESVYATQADRGSNFRIDSTACQYVYNLAASALGVGVYRVDISMNGIMIGHAVFALK